MAEARTRPERTSDAPLVRKAANGDSEAWGRLVDRYSGYVNAVLRSVRVPEADLPDAFQYVFVELFKALAELRQRDTLAPWLRQTAVRHGIRVREKAARGPGNLDDVEHLAVSADEQEALEQAETGRLVRDAVDGLQERCRELIRRLFYEDPPEPYAQVAEALGLKESSMTVTRQRCLDALERALRARGVS